MLFQQLDNTEKQYSSLEVTNARIFFCITLMKCLLLNILHRWKRAAHRTHPGQRELQDSLRCCWIPEEFHPEELYH